MRVLAGCMRKGVEVDGDEILRVEWGGVDRRKVRGDEDLGVGTTLEGVWVVVATMSLHIS